MEEAAAVAELRLSQKKTDLGRRGREREVRLWMEKEEEEGVH